VQEYPLIVLGIMVLAAIILVIDVGMTYLCPQDNTVMDRIGKEGYRCPKCGFFKRS
jgi:tRNA(Ile2) C34 agmatinyltransferase TiaS